MLEDERAVLLVHVLSEAQARRWRSLARPLILVNRWRGGCLRTEVLSFGATEPAKRAQANTVPALTRVPVPKEKEAPRLRSNHR
jgi:hypothetical protein